MLCGHHETVRRQRAEPRQLAEANAAHQHWRGPKNSEAERLAQGHDPQTAGAGDAKSTLPRHAGGYEPVGDGTDQSVLPSSTTSPAAEISGSSANGDHLSV